MVKKRPVALINYVQQLFPKKSMMIDSGVYSLMHLGKLMTADELEKYTRRYVKMILHTGLTCPAVEVDSQYIEKTPGTYKRLRKIYDEYKVSSQIIYVWHYSEGLDALFELMEKHKRIALSPKELLFTLRMLDEGKQYKEQAKALFSKILQKSNGHHVHLLGTMVDWMSYLPHNWTCDSATWTSGLVWGYYLLESPFGFDFRGDKESVSPPIREMVSKAMPKLIEIYNNAPRLTRAKKNRHEFMRKLCICMVSMLEWWEAHTLRNLGKYPKPNDPIDFCGVKRVGANEGSAPLDRLKNEKFKI